MSRIVGKQHLLEGLDQEVFRKMMWKQADFCGVRVLTYAVMTNHFHILVRVPGKVEIDDAELVRRVAVLYGEERAKGVEAALGLPRAEAVREEYVRRMGEVSQFMKELKQRFSIWFNRRRGRVGTLWSERFKSVLVEDGGKALRTVAAYIDLNAVRAGYCRDPKDYRFCGYGEACGGSVEAREGLAQVMERSGWRSASWEYRMILFGKGYYTEVDKEGGISWEQWKAVRANRGRLSLADALRCRVRYFSEGTILGSREYVEAEYSRQREKFGERRRSGARPLRGAEWEGLCAVRDLRKNVIE
jgi:putative transposase